MATTYYSVEITRGDVTRYNEKGNFEVYGHFALSAALIVDDVIQMVKVPNGARVLSMEIYCDDLDTNVAPTILFDIGDDGDTNRFAEAVTLGQSAGFLRGIQTEAGFCYQYTANNTIDLLVNTAPATGATSGDIKMRVTLAMDN